MNRYGLHGKLIATKGNREKLTEILLEASEIVKNAKGSHIYLISNDNEDENTVWVTEVWDSKDDHDNSLELDEVREFIKKAMPYVDGPPNKGHEFSVLGGLGI